MSLNFDKWIIGDGTETGREYLIHTEYPRFIGIIDLFSTDHNNLKDITFLDELRPDASKIATLMREAGEAIAQYYADLEEEDDEL